MQIQVHTDHNIDGHEKLAAWVTGVLEQSLGAVQDRISRIEVHLTDENGAKKNGTADMRCAIEARIEGRGPIAVTGQALTIHEAVTSASDKLARAIDHTLERITDRNADTTHRW
jgi:ribosome-associated translation inhibitor RaiA